MGKWINGIINRVNPFFRHFLSPFRRFNFSTIPVWIVPPFQYFRLSLLTSDSDDPFSHRAESYLLGPGPI
jgi:hypothetical protein